MLAGGSNCVTGVVGSVSAFRSCQWAGLPVLARVAWRTRQTLRLAVEQLIRAITAILAVYAVDAVLILPRLAFRCRLSCILARVPKWASLATGLAKLSLEVPAFALLAL